MAERGRKELVYKGNRLHIFPLVSEQVQWSRHKAGPKQPKKGSDVVVCLECHPGLGIGEIWACRLCLLSQGVQWEWGAKLGRAEGRDSGVREGWLVRAGAE